MAGSFNPAAHVGRSTKSGKWGEVIIYQRGCQRRTGGRVPYGWLYPAWYCCRLKALDLQPPCCRASIRSRLMHVNARARIGARAGHASRPALERERSSFLLIPEPCPRDFLNPRTHN